MTRTRRIRVTNADDEPRMRLSYLLAAIYRIRKTCCEIPPCVYVNALDARAFFDSTGVFYVSENAQDNVPVFRIVPTTTVRPLALGFVLRGDRGAQVSLDKVLNCPQAVLKQMFSAGFAELSGDECNVLVELESEDNDEDE